MKSSRLVASLVAGAACSVAIGMTLAPPATAKDGPWAYGTLPTSGVDGKVKAKYFGDTDTFRVCITAGPTGARLRWKTASLSGTHTRTIYAGRGAPTSTTASRRARGSATRCAVTSRGSRAPAPSGAREHPPVEAFHAKPRLLAVDRRPMTRARRRPPHPYDCAMVARGS